MSKRNIPLSILELLQPRNNFRLLLVKYAESDDCILNLVDRATDSKFFFKIKKQAMEQGLLIYNCDILPFSPNSVGITNINIASKDMGSSINSWLEKIELYDSMETIIDGSIFEANRLRFLKDFELLDEDASFTSFNLQQQLFLDKYLEEIIKTFEVLKLESNDVNNVEMDELKHEAEIIKKGITKETKKVVVEKLARFWAKAQIMGLNVLKEVFVKYITELTVKLITG